MPGPASSALQRCHWCWHAPKPLLFPSLQGPQGLNPSPPIVLAAQGGHTEAVECLVLAGASVGCVGLRGSMAVAVGEVIAEFVRKLQARLQDAEEQVAQLKTVLPG